MKLIKSLLILALFISCSHKESEKYQSFIDLHNNPGGYKCYIIIPVFGCEGCYNLAEKFVIEHALEMRDINFFIVGNMSEKSMRIRYGEEILSLENVNEVKISELDNFEIKGMTYPTTLYLSGNQVDSIAITDFNLLYK